MAVLAKPSANGTRGARRAVAPAALPRGIMLSAMMISAVMISAIMISGCSSGGGAVSTPVTGSRDPARPASPASPSQRACSPWAGLDDLAFITTWLRQMIGDEVIFGASTQAAKRDGLAVVVYADSLDGLRMQLPSPYAQELRDSVLSVAASPYKKTPEQLNTAANAAQSLGTQISNLCF